MAATDRGLPGSATTHTAREAEPLVDAVEVNSPPSNGSKHRRLATDTAWSLASEGAALVAMTLTFLLLSRTLGKAGYGAYIGLFAVIGPFTAVTNGGATLMVLQHIAQSKERPIDVARSAVGIILLLGSLFSAAAIAITLASIDNIGAVPVVALTLGELMLGAMVNLMSAIVFGTDGVVAAARLRIIGNLARVVVVLGLLALGALRIVPYAIATAAVTAVYAAVLMRRVAHAQGEGLLGGRPRRAHLGSVAAYSVGLTGLAIQNDGDKFALSAFGHNEDAGRYGAAYRLVQMGLLPITALVGATHLSFLRADDGDADQLSRALRLSMLSAIYGTIVAIGFWFAAPLAPELLGEFDGTASIIRWLSPLVFLRGAASFAMNGLLGLGHNRLRTCLLVGNAAFASLLYYVAVREHSWKGAVFGTLVSEAALFVVAWACLIVAQRRHNGMHGTLGDPAEVSHVAHAASDIIVSEQW